MKASGFSVKLFIFFIVLFIAASEIPSFSQDSEQVDFKNISGTWSLMYENSYGYSFRLGKNYKAVVILYLNTASIIFKGVFTIEDKDMLRINISEMKREEKVKGLNTRGGFTKAKTSYFIFYSKLINENGKRFLELKPAKISIDGNDSEGYFEPLIKLGREKN